jgi:hypothetical protein
MFLRLLGSGGVFSKKRNGYKFSGYSLFALSYQWPRFMFDPFAHLTTLEEAEIIPGKHSDT